MDPLKLDIEPVQSVKPAGRFPRSVKSKYSHSSAFAILKPYLEGGQKGQVRETAVQICNMLPEEGDSNQHNALAKLLIHLSTQIPYDHPARLRLARVTELIGSSLRCKREENMGSVPFVVKFGELKDLVQEQTIWTEAEYKGVPKFPLRDSERFVNLNAFCALLSASSLWRDSAKLAVWCLGTTFVGRWEPGWEGGLVPDYMIMASAQWIFWYGQALFKRVLWHHDVLDEREFGDLRNGPLLMASWRRWREGFEKSAEDEAHTEKCRRIAKRAAELMRSIDMTTVDTDYEGAWLLGARR